MTTVATHPLIRARPGVCEKSGEWGVGVQAEARWGGKGAFPSRGITGSQESGLGGPSRISN